MHQETLQQIVGELERLLPDRFLGRIFQLSLFSLAIDFGLKSDGFLFISIEPEAPRLYLIRRTARELQKASIPPSSFVQTIRVSLGGGNLRSIKKDNGERVVRFSFSVVDEVEASRRFILLAQLTGRSANLFLLDSDEKITFAWRPPKGGGQQIGELYRPPSLAAPVSARVGPDSLRLNGDVGSISAVVDEYYRNREREQNFDSLAGNLAAKLSKEITKRKKLQANLERDLAAHGNPEEHKRLGDLLLANIANAERDGTRVTLIDYYAEGAPAIEVDVDEHASLQGAASKAFARYAKSKRAITEIGARLLRLKQQLKDLEEKRKTLERAVADRDVAVIAGFQESKIAPTASPKKQKASLTQPGMRRYRSSDGYEVWVGRTARDNDQLTFRVARPNDLWLHAGDYPGSHVIVRNSSRAEIPHRTIIEAAQLAAKFSQASKDSKVTIHYTRRKFLTKPKGSAPGLVRLTNFKTITVEPGENLERIK